MCISGKVLCFEFFFGSQKYWANCNISYSIDNNFGSDADGNRGTTRVFLEDVEVLRVEDLSGYTIEPDDEMIESIKEEATNRF